MDADQGRWKMTKTSTGVSRSGRGQFHGQGPLRNGLTSPRSGSHDNATEYEWIMRG